MILLIIDDDEDDRYLFTELAKEVNSAIECIEGTNGEHGLELLSSLPHPPDFIFLDINMPRLNGFGCLKKIRSNEQWRKIPVVIHSTSQSEEDVDRANALGASYYLVKSGKIDHFSAALRYILQVGRESMNEGLATHLRILDSEKQRV